MLDPVAMGYDPLSEIGATQRRNLAAALLVCTDSAPESARDPMWIDGAQVALLWLRDPNPDNLGACREMLAPIRENAPSLAEDSDAASLANAVRWVLEMIVYTRFGPAQVKANEVAVRAVMDEAQYLCARGGSTIDMHVGKWRACARFWRNGGALSALRWP